MGESRINLEEVAAEECKTYSLLSKVRSSKEKYASMPGFLPRAAYSGFTLVELLVVIGVIGVLGALLLPALSSARRRAKEVVSISNIKQIYMGSMMFATDNNETWIGSEPVIGITNKLSQYTGPPLMHGDYNHGRLRSSIRDSSIFFDDRHSHFTEDGPNGKANYDNQTGVSLSAFEIRTGLSLTELSNKIVIKQVCERLDDGLLRAPYDGERMAICSGSGSAQMISIDASYITSSSNSNEEVWNKLDQR